MGSSRAVRLSGAITSARQQTTCTVTPESTRKPGPLKVSVSTLFGSPPGSGMVRVACPEGTPESTIGVALHEHADTSRPKSVRYVPVASRVIEMDGLDARVTALRVPSADAGTSPCPSIGSESGPAKGRAGEEEAQP